MSTDCGILIKSTSPRTLGKDLNILKELLDKRILPRVGTKLNAGFATEPIHNINDLGIDKDCNHMFGAVDVEENRFIDLDYEVLPKDIKIQCFKCKAVHDLYRVGDMP